MTQQFDIYGKPLSGGQLYIIQAGTVSTPQDAFQDFGLTIKMPYPMTLDAAGRVPQFFLADGTVKIRLQDKSGVVQLASDSVLVIGPSSGSGGGGTTVDPTQLIQVGTMILRYGIDALAGYVRLNGLTIGSTTSSASERRNPDCQNLFQYLWNTDPNLAVTPLPRTTASGDWTANKQIALPDWRGYAVGGLDDMGNVPANRLSSAYFGASPITLGAVGGVEFNSLIEANLAPHSHNVFLNEPLHGHTLTALNGANVLTVAGGPEGYGGGSGAHNGLAAMLQLAQSKTNVTIGSVNGVANDNRVGPTGNSIPFRTIGPRKLCTFYLKL